MVSAPAGQVGELGVERAADERTDPAAAWRDGEGVGSVAGAEPVRLDHPRDVHLGARPQAGDDAERYAVHAAQGRRRSPHSMMQLVPLRWEP